MVFTVPTVQNLFSFWQLVCPSYICIYMIVNPTNIHNLGQKKVSNGDEQKKKGAWWIDI